MWIRRASSVSLVCRTAVSAATVLGGMGRIGLCSTIAAALWSTSTHAADERRIPFEIAGGTLESTIQQFSEQAGVTVKVEAPLPAHRPVQGIRESMTARRALQALLKGSGLEALLADDGTYRIVTLGARDAADQDLPPVVVTGKSIKEAAYAATSTRSSTRTDTDIVDLPQAVTVISREQLEQQQITSVAEALEGVQGIRIQERGNTTSLTMRGFNATVMVDGLSEGDSYANGVSVGGLSRPIAAIERIDVLAGADAVLAGAGAGQSFGGTVNVTLKRPQKEPVRQVSAEIGSSQHGQLDLDLAGAFTDDKVWLYRTVASATDDRHSPAGFDHGNRDAYLLASAGLRLPGTAVNVGLESQSTSAVKGPALAIRRDGVTDQFSPPGNAKDRFVTKRSSTFLEITRELPLEWHFQSNLKESRTTAHSQYYEILPTGFLQEDPASYEFFSNATRYRWSVSAIDASAHKTFEAESFTNTVLMGGSFEHTRLYTGATSEGFSGGPDFVFGEIKKYTNPLNDVYVKDSNIYIQDQLKFEPWAASLSLARSSEWGGRRSIHLYDPRQSALSPSFGLLYAVSNLWSIFGNYRKSFYPQATALLVDSTTAPPLRALNKELGVKLSLDGGKLIGNCSLFSVRNQNQLQQLSGSDRFEVIGRSDSKGLDASLTGELSPRLRGSASYTYTKVKQSNISIDGFSPLHSLRIFTNYNLTGDQQKGFSLGAGVTAQSSYMIELDGYDIDTSTGTPISHFSSYRVPGHILWDTNIAYQSEGWRVAFGIKNLFDKLAYGNGDQTNLPILPGRTFLLSARTDF